MSGIGEPHLIIRGSMSPHNFSLRPSDARMLENADVVFLIGEAMETSVASSIDTLAADARVVELAHIDGMVRRPLREGGNFEEGHAHGDHEDDEHGEPDHDNHGAARHDDHADDHDDHGAVDHDDRDGGEGHDHDDSGGDTGHGDHHGAFDMHVWLDPVNSMAMVNAIAETLAEADPANALTYSDNAAHLRQRLLDLRAEVAAAVAPVQGEGFIVFHDAYRHFEDRFGMVAVGSAVVSADSSPGVRRIRALRSKVRDLDVKCVMSEPQFDARLVNVIVEGTGAKTGSVDPLGAAVESGPELYFTLLRDMASSFRSCLSP